MPKQVFERLTGYFQEVANVLAGEKSASSIFPNTSDTGMVREKVLKNFLNNHLPKRCEVINGGFVFDNQGHESNQLDIIVTNDLTLQFKHHNKSFNCIEGCNAVISVKSNLDKQQLFEALNNIASVPIMPDDAVNSITHTIENREEILNHPIKIIFAYEGNQLETTMSNIREYYDNNDISQRQRPHMIIVNNKYFIVRIEGQGGVNRAGQRIPPNTFYPMNPLNVGAFALLSMIGKIQTAANVNSHMLFSFNKYIDKVPT